MLGDEARKIGVILLFVAGAAIGFYIAQFLL